LNGKKQEESVANGTRHFQCVVSW